MIVPNEYYRTRSDGVVLVRTYSDEGFWIIRNDGERFAEAIDAEGHAYTYTESDEPVEVPSEEVPEEPPVEIPVEPPEEIPEEPPVEIPEEPPEDGSEEVSAEVALAELLEVLE